MEYLLKNAYFPFEGISYNIHIKNGKIVKLFLSEEEVSSSDNYDAIENLENRIVIPGFVDAHTHLDKTLIGKEVRNKSGTLEEAIELMTVYKKRMSKEEVFYRARKAIEASIKKGTRYIRTHVDIDEQIKLDSLKALIALREEYKDSIEIQIVAFPQQGINESDKNLFYLEKALEAGADLIGGIPALEKNPREHIEKIFRLAIKYDVDIDMHVDETDDPNSLTIKDVLDFTKKYGYRGRVSVGHLCSLAAYTAEELNPLVSEIVEAQINVISLPSTNLYLQGRSDKKEIRRGIAPIKYLYEKNVPVMIGSDNNQDPFNPFGNFDMLEEALIAAHGTHMGGEKDLEALFDMISIIPGKNLKFQYKIEENKKADFIILDAHSKSEAIINQSMIFGKFNDDGLTIIHPNQTQ